MISTGSPMSIAIPAVNSTVDTLTLVRVAKAKEITPAFIMWDDNSAQVKLHLGEKHITVLLKDLISAVTCLNS
jgi:hypothetical protein